MQVDDNPLNNKDYPPVPGRSLIIFVVAVTLLAVGAIQLLAGLSELTIIGWLYVIGLLSVAVAVAPMGRAALPALAFRGAGWKPIVLGSIAALVLSIIAGELGPEVKGMKDVARVGREPGGLLPSFIAFAVLAPLVEELIFRGLIYGWIEGRWGWRPAFVVSSLAFSAAHFEPAHIILVLPLGFLFGWLRHRSQSLLPSLVAHMINNGFAVLSLLLLESG